MKEFVEQLIKEQAENDKDFAELLKKENKSVDECCKYIIGEAYKIAKDNRQGNCVYACGYYKKTDSLILVAEISGKRAELIELNLNSKKIIQCRGKWNKQTTDHDRIMNLLKSNLIKIKKSNLIKIKKCA